MFRSSDLPKLLKAQPGPCLSMYIDTKSHPQSSNVAKKRWQKTFDEVDSRIKRNYTKHHARFLLEPLRSMPELLSKPFPDSKGIALFRSFTTAGYYPIEEHTSPLTAVSDTFHLKPLLKLIQRQERYSALALNQRCISLYRGGRNAARLVARFHADYGEKEVKIGADHHAGGSRLVVPRGKLARDIVLHFRPVKRVSRFLELAEPHVWKELRGESGPLILVGTPFMHRLYRNMNCYPHLSKNGVLASLPHRARTIHERAWPIAKQEQLVREQGLIEQYYEAKHRDQAFDKPDTIAKACIEGRVSTLLISKEAKLFGLLDRERGKILAKDVERDSFGDDVLDDIAQEVILRKGAVHVLNADAMPDSSAIAAVFRW
ncbi:MAG: hypothetical protein R3B54_06950 [Bdellovibrionota bacterium]